MNRIGRTHGAVHFQPQPTVAQRIGRVASGNFFFVIGSVLDLDYNSEAAFWCQAFGLACSDRKRPLQLPGAEKPECVRFFVHDNQV
ncbi:hypothetical protein D3C81_1869740 [compost metagenome]